MQLNERRSHANVFCEKLWNAKTDFEASKDKDKDRIVRNLEAFRSYLDKMTLYGTFLWVSRATLHHRKDTLMH